MSKKPTVVTPKSAENPFTCVGCGSDGSNLLPGMDPKNGQHYFHAIDTSSARGVCGPCALQAYKCMTLIMAVESGPLARAAQPKPRVAIVRGL